MRKDRIPVKLISASFLGRLDFNQKKALDEWLSKPGNAIKYNVLEDLWKQISNDISLYVPDRDLLWKRLQRKIDTRHRYNSKHVIHWIAASVVIFLFVTGTWMVVGNIFTEKSNTIVSVESMSGKSRVSLPDGTIVWMNSKSSILYDKDSFGEKERMVSLTGEAFFDVAKDEDKPFFVITNDLKVTVTGTKFNVENTDNLIAVSLLEGSVNMSLENGQTVSLKSGQKGIYDRSKSVLSFMDGDVNKDVCWASESLSFNGRPLGEICSYLSSWYGVQIILDSSLESQFAYSFTVKDESLEEILRLMSEINPLKYKKISESTVLLSICE